MKTKKRGLCAAAVALLVALTTAAVVYAAHPTFQWVIGATGIAAAANNSRIALTGNGTFQVKPGNAHVTGGGTWTTSSPTGAVTGSGTYQVTDLVRFDLAPGAIGDPTVHAGLAVLQIAYSDGEEGVLVVSCHLPGTPDSVAEGISATKGFVNYWRGFMSVGGSGAFFRALG